MRLSGAATVALSLLPQECVALGEGFDPSEAHAFAPLKSEAQFRQLGEQVRRGFPPVHRARVAFTLAQRDLFPEGLAADAVNRIFFMGSMHQNKIVRITESGEMADFVKEGVYEVMRWADCMLTPWITAFGARRIRREERSEIVRLDAQGKLLEPYTAPGPGAHDLNDRCCAAKAKSMSPTRMGTRCMVSTENRTVLPRWSFPERCFIPTALP